MNKYVRVVCTGFFLVTLASFAEAANLIEAYQQALTSDPAYQKAISQRLVTKEGVPISLAQLLPNIGVAVNPTATRSGYSGSTVDSTPLTPRNNTNLAYTLQLSASQTVFNFAQFMTVAVQQALAKGADATLNAALQNLMVRVSQAYFAVLNDEDVLVYNEASKKAYQKQYELAAKQFKVGTLSITDVYAAKASYDTASANFIQAQNQVIVDKENLRAITGRYYDKLAKLRNTVPLTPPHPANVDAWVNRSFAQNWSIKSAQYSVEGARQSIRQQLAGHLPTVSVQATLDRQYTHDINGTVNILQRNGAATQLNHSVQVNINVPIFSGGGVDAQTNQAVYAYQLAQQQMEATIRAVLTLTRQSYVNIIAGINKIRADKEAIESTAHSVDTMEQSYRIGEAALVDVLNQQQRLFIAQSSYATDRYTLINNMIVLKEAAGTLSFNDLAAINHWLTA